MPAIKDLEWFIPYQEKRQEFITRLESCETMDAVLLSVIKPMISDEKLSRVNEFTAGRRDFMLNRMLGNTKNRCLISVDKHNPSLCNQYLTISALPKIHCSCISGQYSQWSCRCIRAELFLRLWVLTILVFTMS